MERSSFILGRAGTASICHSARAGKGHCNRGTQARPIMNTSTKWYRHTLHMAYAKTQIHTRKATQGRWRCKAVHRLQSEGHDHMWQSSSQDGTAPAGSGDSESSGCQQLGEFPGGGPSNGCNPWSNTRIYSNLFGINSWLWSIHSSASDALLQSSRMPLLS